MSDLDRYLTDELVVDAMVPHVACCPDCPDPVDAANQRGMAVAALSAVLPGIIQQAKAEAWEEGHRMSDLNWRHIYDGHPCDEGEMCSTCCQPNPYRTRKDDR